MANGSGTPVVTSLLENDLYKFTMWQALLHSHPGAQAEYRLPLPQRSRTIPLAELREEVEDQLDHLCTLSFRQDELDYLRGLRFIKSDFVDYLTIFRFQRRFIQVSVRDGQLVIKAAGPIAHVMAFEVFVLYIVNQLYYRRLPAGPEFLEAARRRLREKVRMVKACAGEPAAAGFPFLFMDFGLRRRYSGEWQEEVVATFARELPEHFTGTSNVLLARKLALVPAGTMAHEYLQAYQAFGSRLRDFQKAALEAWVQEYRGDLGTALTDVVGMDAFLADFDLYFAKLFDGLRHDSGDPIAWGEKAIAHYQKLRIDPRTKRLVFSDALDLPRAMAIHRHFRDRIPSIFGIGTNLTNDTPHRSLNIVMKMVSCGGQPVAKLSDAPGKTMCEDPGFLAYLRQVFNHPE